MGSAPTLRTQAALLDLKSSTLGLLLPRTSTTSSGFVENAGYMRTSAGVFVSHDAGVNWQRTGKFPASEGFVEYNLAENPGNPNILLAATKTKLISSMTLSIRRYDSTAYLMAKNDQ